MLKVLVAGRKTNTIWVWPHASPVTQTYNVHIITTLLTITHLTLGSLISVVYIKSTTDPIYSRLQQVS